MVDTKTKQYVLVASFLLVLSTMMYSQDLNTKDTLRLNGTWEFAWGRFVEPGMWDGEKEKYPQDFSQITLPGYWTTKGFPAHGHGTYRLLVQLNPAIDVYALDLSNVLTSWELWVNGTSLGRVGKPGINGESTKPQDGRMMMYFHPHDGPTEIIIQVANYDYRKGGVLEGPLVMDADQAQAKYLGDIIGEVLILGGLLIMTLYHLGLFIIRRQDLSSLWFGLFCLVILLRFLVTGSYLAGIIMPNFDWELAKKLELLIFTLGNIPFMLFLYTLFPQEVGSLPLKITLGTSLLAGIPMLILPARIANNAVEGLQIYVILLFAYYISAVVRAKIRGRLGAGIFLLGIFILLGSSINDILYANQAISTGYILPPSFFVVILLQAFILSRNYNDSFKKVASLTRDLTETNQSLSRFIPHEFLNLLGRESITKVQLGDQVQGEMSVMFSDIRKFSTISEAMTPLETFSFLNSYFGRVGHIIRGKNGFIDKYLGDGILALFPRSPDDALDAAIELQRSLVEFNKARVSLGQEPLDVGTGIHFGRLSLGTIGELGRMDTTVIADAVNIASRMEALTKSYGLGTIVAFSFLDKLSDPDKYHWRYLGLIRVQGRSEPLEAVHVYDGLCEADFLALHAGKSLFEEALGWYRNGDLEKARQGFSDLVVSNPRDLAARTYLQRIQFLLNTGLPEDWDGIETGPIK